MVPSFAYRARNSQGRTLKGSLSADSPRHARDLLREQNLVILTIRSSVDSPSTLFSAFHPRYRHQATTFFRELSTLLAVGIPLVDSLDILISQLRGGFQGLVRELRDAIASGHGLAKSLGRFPRVFDPFCLSMAEVGENAGTLDVNLSQLAEFREHREQMKDRILSSLLYPMIVATITFGVTIFLMTAVVPTLLQNLIEMERPLPWPTRFLKALSDFLLVNGFGLLLAFLVLTLVSILFAKSSRGSMAIHRLLLTLPVFGALVRKQNCSRVSLFIGTLVQSGIDPLRAFEITSATIQNPLYRQALTGASQAIASGREFRLAFTPYASLFPATVIQLFALGQNSGQLDTMLLRLARDLDRETATIAGRIATLVEPILIVGLGIIVGFVLLATMLPILEAGNVL